VAPGKLCPKFARLGNGETRTITVMGELSPAVDVVQLQRGLQALGFYRGAIDGNYGPVSAQAVADYQTWRGFAAGSAVDQLMLDTMAADVQTYASGGGQAEDVYGGGEVAADPDAAVRAAAIAAATGEIGKVRSKSSGGEEAGREVRYGWERLVEYFDVAAPGVWPEEHVKFLGDGLPSWCGIFTLWALKTGGANVGTWAIGRGIPDAKVTSNPGPGDIGYMEQNQHYCLIERVEGGTIYSIDGNTVGDDTGGGEVNDRARPRSAYQGFLTVF